MIGDQQQIKELRFLYNSQLHVKIELEDKLRKIKLHGNYRPVEAAEYLIKIIELKCELIQIDETINQLSSLQ